MKYLIANWKMNMGYAQITTWCHEFEKRYEPKENLSIIICPSFPYLPIIKSFALKLENVFCGAQNFSQKEKGAHTGETGLFQIQDFAQYVLLGHSETKEILEDVKQKVAKCLANSDLTPIICHKDTENAFAASHALHVFEDPNNISEAGQNKSTDMARITGEINLMGGKLGTAEILYGGSVNRQNAKDLVEVAGAIGLLAGNASLDPLHFLELAEGL